MMHTRNDEEIKSMVLLCCKTYQALRGLYPGISELCSMTGIKSYLTIERCLRDLRREGLISETFRTSAAAV